MRSFNFSVYMLSVCVGLAFAVMAVILCATVSGHHIWLLRSAGCCLFGVVVAHLFSLRWLGTRSQLWCYLCLTIAAVWGFAALYYLAETDDPFRSEGEMFSDTPFRLACFFFILPAIRAAIRMTSIRSTVNASPVTDSTNQDRL
jgi:hypothetical protein